MKSIDYADMSRQIVDNVGGKQNITKINHCATRLRLNVKDIGKVDKEELKKIPNVLGVEVMHGQLQIIVGQIIEDLYDSFNAYVGKTASLNASSDEEEKNKTVIDVVVNFLQLVAKIMAPVIPALIVAGFISLIMIAGQLWFGFKNTDSTYIILNSLGQSAFYFLPVMVAYTSAKQFDTEPALAILLAGFLLYPDWVSLVNKGSATGFTSYFGLPAHLQTYNGQVVQIILSIWIMSKLDKWLKKVIPNSFRYFLKPVILMIAMSIITLTVSGPLGGLFTNYIGAFINFVRQTVPWLTVPAIYLFAMTVGVFMPGFHLALIPIATQNLTTLGYDDIINIWFMAGTIVPGFVALWVALKVKNTEAKNIAWPAAISALFGGISEPTLYGILYRIPKLYGITAVAGLLMSIYNGIVGTKAYAYGAYYLTNLLLFYNAKDPANLYKAIGGIVLVAVVTFVGVWFTKWSWEDTSNSVTDSPIKLAFMKKKEDEPKESTTSAVDQETELQSSEILSPVEGKLIPQEKIEDKAFSSGALGKCFAIMPVRDDICSPIAGTINSVAPTKHAITIYGNKGEQVMVHISLDSQKIDQNDIDVLVSVGDRVVIGQRMAVLHRDRLKQKNLSDIVITTLLNTSSYKKVDATGDKLIAIA